MNINNIIKASYRSVSQFNLIKSTFKPLQQREFHNVLNSKSYMPLIPMGKL